MAIIKQDYGSIGGGKEIVKTDVEAQSAVAISGGSTYTWNTSKRVILAFGTMVEASNTYGVIYLSDGTSYLNGTANGYDATITSNSITIPCMSASWTETFTLNFVYE